MLKKIKGLLIEEDGQGLVEYGLIIGLVGVVVAVALTALEGKITALFNGISFTK